MKNESVKVMKADSAIASKMSECYECGVCTSNCPVAYMIPMSHNPRATMLRLFLYPEKAASQIGLWLCMRCRRCSDRCPQKLSPHELFLHARTALLESDSNSTLAKMREALRLVRERLPLPFVSAWLCLRPDESDDSSSTASKFVTDALTHFVKLRQDSPEVERKSGLGKVAIIGSGPAGLAAANELARKGYSVEILEKSSAPGGMLHHGIPAFRLPKEVLGAEVDRLNRLGVKIRTSICVGEDINIPQLFEEGNRALFVASGCTISSELKVDGENLEGVIYALDFLRDTGMGRDVKLGDSAVVIGGGNVAVDSARVALRKGAEVHLFYRRTREEMPSNQSEIMRAEREGIRITCTCMPKRIVGKNGKVCAVEFIKTKPGQYDREGKSLLVPIEGSEFIVDTNLVIVAVGQKADLGFLPKEIRASRHGMIEINRFNCETSMQGVFAGGDVVSGPASVFEAIHAGWMAANAIDEYLKPKKQELAEPGGDSSPVLKLESGGRVNDEIG